MEGVKEEGEGENEEEEEEEETRRRGRRRERRRKSNSRRRRGRRAGAWTQGSPLALRGLCGRLTPGTAARLAGAKCSGIAEKSEVRAELLRLVLLLFGGASGPLQSWARAAE